MRDPLAVWGEQETQDQVHKVHCNRDMFKCVAQQMQAHGHSWVWMQCWAMMKWMKIQYKCGHGANEKSGGKGPNMPFYEELSFFLTTYRALTAVHMYSTTGEGEELLAGTAPQEEVQEISGMMGQLGA